MSKPPAIKRYGPMHFFIGGEVYTYRLPHMRTRNTYWLWVVGSELQLRASEASEGWNRNKHAKNGLSHKTYEKISGLILNNTV
ncbi:predicted protein [Sclerotinia sclerotiorum 1980 UF-70]|uniref:Uncharacterized protein n=1 Tax=Sclerotinia sclerotiorum (strain ATCC 18683 / 1980 / Ss-1) TaxID=665079 RepID=A7F3E4_SCLS1|nr:predicted protein [Sclerotinia sclerotiorum 1980 UF-70]EDN97265.1 predicted protein [Sclerotinia sclerotiorum 1980 UF-70]